VKIGRDLTFIKAGGLLQVGANDLDLRPCLEHVDIFPLDNPRIRILLR